MPNSQPSLAENNRTYRTDAPSYCRHSDWWKKPEGRSCKEQSTSKCIPGCIKDAENSRTKTRKLDAGEYIYRKSGYQVPRKKKSNWSILVLASGLDGLTEAENKFRHYAAKWKEEIGGDSSLTNITSNMNYLRIISIGDEAIPLILQELQREPAPWFVALRAISEEDSVGRDSPGNFRKIAASWIQWGKDRAYI